jgi:hypothetical protein
MESIQLSSLDVCETSRWAFIAGAPRCGTTSIARYLRAHPDVCFSNTKEPHFFAAQDLRDLSDSDLRRVVQEQYLDRFFPHRRSSSMLAEGSVSYLYFPERLEPLLRLWPRAKFIISLRSPFQMIPSLHQRLYYIGQESENDLERAWKLVPTRREGLGIPKQCSDPRLLDFWEIGQLGKHLDRFLSTVGRECCFVSVFDDFKADPAGQYRRLLNFLELPDDGRTEFPRFRESRGCKSIRLQRLLRRPPAVAVKALGFSTDETTAPTALKGQSVVLEMRKRLLRWNRAPAPPPVITPSLLNEMRGEFREDIGLLGTLLGRDLSHWLD